jgi:hypothetical protein
VVHSRSGATGFSKEAKRALLNRHRRQASVGRVRHQQQGHIQIAAASRTQKPDGIQATQPSVGHDGGVGVGGKEGARRTTIAGQST